MLPAEKIHVLRVQAPNVECVRKDGKSLKKLIFIY